jgi:hypothetical protein
METMMVMALETAALAMEDLETIMDTRVEEALLTDMEIMEEAEEDTVIQVDLL